jgi:hypothetical protein
MRARRSWNVVIVLVAVSLTVTLQLGGATETSAAIGAVAAEAVPNTTALDAAGGPRSWSTVVGIVSLAVANLVSLARRQPSRRAEDPPDPTPWERLVAARY